MDRRHQPPTAIAPDIPARDVEIRAPKRSGEYEARSRGEVEA